MCISDLIQCSSDEDIVIVRFAARLSLEPFRKPVHEITHPRTTFLTRLIGNTMLKSIRLRIIGLAFIILSAPNLASAQPVINFDADALTAKLEEVHAEAKTVGFAIGIIKDGCVVYAHGFGKKKLAGDPITTDSIFHWASVSKPFVATAIMQLSERGKLDLDARLVDILPDYVVTEPAQLKITIRQILLHISGIPDVEEYNWDKPEFDDGALQRWTLKNAPRALLFEPGTHRTYSNLGFETLGAVIERVSGETFENYMAANIFKPLKMDDATFFYPDTPKAKRVNGHVGKSETKRIVKHYPYNRRHAPSSTLNMSIDGMARYAMTLLNGGTIDGARILDEETLIDMWIPRWTRDEEPLRAGAMGWDHRYRNGHRLLLHSGWDDGFRSTLILLPDLKQAVYFVTNDENSKPRDFIVPALVALDGAVPDNLVTSIDLEMGPASSAGQQIAKLILR